MDEIVHPVSLLQSGALPTENIDMISRDAAVYGIDIGKNIFNAIVVHSTGQTVQRVKLRSHTLLEFFERAKPAS